MSQRCARHYQKEWWLTAQHLLHVLPPSLAQYWQFVLVYLGRLYVGAGAKNGESVSTNNCSGGTSFSASRSSGAFLKVSVPAKDKM